MFDIGFWELLVIGVVALLVVGPERLPGVARKAGRWVGQIQRFVRNARDDIQRELEAENLKSMLDEQEKQIHELRSMVQDKTSGGGLSELSEQLNQSAEELNRGFRDPTPAKALASEPGEPLPAPDDKASEKTSEKTS